MPVRFAGSEAHGRKPGSIETVQEVNVDIAGEEPLIVDARMLQRAGIEATVCGRADEQCPVLPPGITKRHWTLTDPAKAIGTDEEIMRELRSTRDNFERRARALLGTVQEGDTE